MDVWATVLNIAAQIQTYAYHGDILDFCAFSLRRGNNWGKDKNTKDPGWNQGRDAAFTKSPF